MPGLREKRCSVQLVAAELPMLESKGRKEEFCQLAWLAGHRV